MSKVYVVCTAKPSDGLFHYSYEYTYALNEMGIDATCLYLPNPNFTVQDYIMAVKKKYRYYGDIGFIPDVEVNPSDITLVMGRSMITIPYLRRTEYSSEVLFVLNQLFTNVISVYSENHTEEQYQEACKFFNVKKHLDICDLEVYNNGTGLHFEKRINFDIYKKVFHKPICEHLFLGTNPRYYRVSSEKIDGYDNSSILVYKNQKNLLSDISHIYAPVDNLCGLFKTYVYTKDTFDPAPRLVQECKYYNKNMIYDRDETMVDGGSVYWKRDLQDPDCSAILECIEELS